MGKKLSRQRRRGLQVLLWTAAMFLVIQVASGLFLEHYGLSIRFPYAAEVLLALQEKRQSPDVAIFGSSRFGTDLSATRAEALLRRETGDNAVTVFNAAVPAGDLVVSDYLLERMLKMGVRPRIAIVEISPENLSDRNRWLRDHLRRQVTWDEVPHYVTEIVQAGHTASLLASLFTPLSIHRYHVCKEVARLTCEDWNGWTRPFVLSADLNQTAEPKRDDTPAPRTCIEILRACGLDTGCCQHRSPLIPASPDWNPATHTAPNGTPLDVAMATGVSGYRDWLRNYTIGGVSAEALERLLQRCHRHGIVPVLVVPPVVKAQEVLHTDDVCRRFFAHLETLRANYPFGLVDCRGSLPDQCFADNHHANEEGQSLFTDLVARDILTPVWQEYRK